jgi:uncharacterized membrane-anchored protein YhcB (DUF1043 family)
MSVAGWITLLLGLLAGAGLGYWLGLVAQRRQGGGKSAAELRQQHDQFREQVTDHFAETAELVNKLTDSYKDVFDHLSSGAQQLADMEKLQQRLPPVENSTVSIQRIGYAQAKAGTAAPVAATSAAEPSVSGASQAAKSDHPKPSKAVETPGMPAANVTSSAPAQVIDQAIDQAADRAADRATSKSGADKPAASKPVAKGTSTDGPGADQKAAAADQAKKHQNGKPEIGQKASEPQTGAQQSAGTAADNSGTKRPRAAPTSASSSKADGKR